MKTILILAALATMPLGQPAFAETITQTAVVQHSDLDLATSAGAKTFKLRLWRAVVDVCGTTSEFDIKGQNDIRQCRRETLQAASTQADLAIAGASRGEPVRVASIRN